MSVRKPTTTALRVGLAAAVVLTTAATGAGLATAGSKSDSAGDSNKSDSASENRDQQSDTPVSVQIVSPHRGDNAGIGGAAWIVDLALRYPGGPAGRTASGFSPQLTGPALHNNTPPFPGTFSTGRDDRLPGLVVLTSTTKTGAPFSGPGTNLANLFNVTGLANSTDSVTEIRDNWIVGAAIAGKDVTTVLTVAVVADLNGNGIYDDAPVVVPDANGDGRIDAQDLEALGLASQVETVTFRINGAA